MFTPEQEAAFQKEMDGIAAEVAADKAQQESKPNQETAHAENDQDDADDLETESNSETEDSDLDDAEDTEIDEEDSSDDESDEPDSEEEELSSEDESTEETEISAKKKADTKEVRKSLARQQRKHEAEITALQARFDAMQAQLAVGSSQQNVNQQQNAQPVDLQGQRQKRIDDMVTEGFDPAFAAQMVIHEEKREQQRLQETARNQAAEAEQKFKQNFTSAQAKITQAVGADPELKKLGEAYRGTPLSQPMQMALGKLDKPGRVLKHILKNEPQLITNLSNKSPEEQYAQLLIMGGRLEAQREFQKQKNQPKAKPVPGGKLQSRGAKESSDSKDDPMKWSDKKLLKEMGL